MASKEKEERVNELTEINIKLDVFEGPLDLLLHLIQQMEIDIYDIPIATITEQYMNYIHTMKTLELAVAGEYLVMAATLMAIKSKTLLPVQEFVTDDEELWEEDPREELVTQLLEYRKYKYAAEKLTEKDKKNFTKKDWEKLKRLEQLEEEYNSEQWAIGLNHGKIVASEELDEIINTKFKECPTELFKTEDED